MNKMLHIDPHKRLTAGEVLKHPWVAMRDNLPHMRLTLQDAQAVKVTCGHTFMCLWDTSLTLWLNIIDGLLYLVVSGDTKVIV